MKQTKVISVFDFYFYFYFYFLLNTLVLMAGECQGRSGRAVHASLAADTGDACERWSATGGTEPGGHAGTGRCHSLHARLPPASGVRGGWTGERGVAMPVIEVRYLK